MKNRTISVIVIALLIQILAVTCLYAEERFFEIRAKKFVYTPNIITVDKGDTVRIRLISEDVRHGLYLDGYGIKTEAYPGEDGSLTFVAGRSGRFTFRCSVTCGEFHPYMVGHLRVEPNSQFHIFALSILGLGIVAVISVISRRRGEEQDG
jgi:cytochrome c oxidase subunit 2